jgi:hypothetical protein
MDLRGGPERWCAVEQILFVAVGVGRLEHAVPPAAARGWRAVPADTPVQGILGTVRPAVEFHRADVPFTVVVVENRRFGPVTILAEDETGQPVQLRRAIGAAFQRACLLGHPEVLDLLASFKGRTGIKVHSPARPLEHAAR